VAKAVSNKQDKGKGKADGSAGKGAKAPARRADGKPARKTQTRQQPARKNAPKERRGFAKFLRDVRVEMSKVSWPSRRDLIQSTLVVLVAVFIAAAFTGIVDFAFQRFVDVVLKVIT
jgi:preprotein translocase subunit SecE